MSIHASENEARLVGMEPGSGASVIVESGVFQQSHPVRGSSRFMRAARELRAVRRITLAGASLAALVWIAPNSRAAEPPDEAPVGAGLAAMGFVLADRARVPLALGPVLGARLFGRLDLSARFVLPVIQLGDVCSRADIIRVDELGVFTCIPSGDARFAYGVRAGYAFDQGRFSAIPGLIVLRTNESDHGTLAALGGRFEWRSHPGIRLGLELAVGVALSQRVLGSCRNHVVAPCEIGSTREIPLSGARHSVTGLAELTAGIPLPFH